MGTTKYIYQACLWDCFGDKIDFRWLKKETPLKESTLKNAKVQNITALHGNSKSSESLQNNSGGLS